MPAANIAKLPEPLGEPGALARATHELWAPMPQWQARSGVSASRLEQTMNAATGTGCKNGIRGVDRMRVLRMRNSANASSAG